MTLRASTEAMFKRLALCRHTSHQGYRLLAGARIG